MASKPLDQRPIHTPYTNSHHRVKTAEGFKIDGTYLKRYYSVIDAEIFFGNEFVEDIAFIDWNVNQHVLPLFGYNSYTYDELARGSRIVSGTFDINFTSPNYLFDILKTAKDDSITNMKSYIVHTPADSVGAINQNLQGKGIDGNKYGPIWPETFDIDIIYGQNTGIGEPVHIFLEGVAIQSCQQVLSGSATDSPPVIRERYTFIAKDFKTVG